MFLAEQDFLDKQIKWLSDVLCLKLIRRTTFLLALMGHWSLPSLITSVGSLILFNWPSQPFHYARIRTLKGANRHPQQEQRRQISGDAITFAKLGN